MTFYSFTDPGMLGFSNFDLSANDFPPGSTTPGQVVYSNLDVSTAPEPAAWLLSLFGIGLSGAATRTRRARRGIG